MPSSACEKRGTRRDVDRTTSPSLSFFDATARPARYTLSLHDALPISEDDLRAMERELRDAIRAGAIGFTTSRSPIHETPDGRPVASRPSGVSWIGERER